MKYGRMGRTGLVVSEVCMGAMTFGGEADEAESGKIVARCLDAGVNFFDTADVYTGGRSEKILGKLLRERRDEVVLATKVFNATGSGPNDMGLSRKHIVQACEASLRRLGTDYVDLYQTHADDAWTPLDETMAALDQLVSDGKVRYLGASNHTAWRLNEALWTSDTGGYARYECLQPLYNLIERGLDAEVLPLCRDKGVGVIVWSPLAGGWLTGKYRSETADDARHNRRQNFPMGVGIDRDRVLDGLLETAKRLGASPAQVALRWVMDQEGITSVIVGARNLDQLEDNLGAVDLELAFDDWKALDRLSRPPLVYPGGIGIAMERRRREQLAQAESGKP
ncbi:MAG: aldo/keto reductase [Proteobacteria bacterium]|nr:aldo/keto reductase [Pseudomonadota bacterium]